MTNTNAWNAAAALAWREIIRFFRQRNRIVGSIGTPLRVLVAVWGGTVGFVSRRPRPNRRRIFSLTFFPRQLALDRAVHGHFSSSISIIEDRREGFFAGSARRAVAAVVDDPGQSSWWYAGGPGAGG